MTTLDIPAHEHGQVRVIAVNRPIADMARALRDNATSVVIADLLERRFPDDTVELFAVADLTGVGLPRYLSDGHAIPDDQIATDGARLSALDGYVLLIRSAAFGGKDDRLTLGPDLTLIGTYGEARPDMSAEPIVSDAAQPYTGVPNQTPRTPPRGGAGGSLIVLAVIVLVGLLLWWLL
jgi:hypothetical protein